MSGGAWESMHTAILRTRILYIDLGPLDEQGHEVHRAFALLAPLTGDRVCGPESHVHLGVAQQRFQQTERFVVRVVVEIPLSREYPWRGAVQEADGRGEGEVGELRGLETGRLLQECW